MAWQGLLDAWTDPTAPNAASLAGLFGGLSQFGAALAQAGAPRPVGQPGPGMADAFGAFSAGTRAGMLNSRMAAQAARQDKKAQLQADALDTSKPDDALSPAALALRQTYAKMPEDLRALAATMDPDQVTGLAAERATKSQRPMTADELAAGGYRPGSVVYVSDWTGAPNLVQASDVKSPEAFKQRMQEINAGHAPRAQWSDVRDDAGNIIGQRDARTGQYQAINAPAMSAGQAANVLWTLGPKVAAGVYGPGTPEFNKYATAHAVATAPKTDYVPDPTQPGQLRAVTRPTLQIPPQFPDPSQLLAPQGAAPPAVTAPPAAAEPAPAVPAVAGPPSGEQVPPPVALPAAPTQAQAPARINPEMAKKLLSGEEEARKLQDATDNYIALLRKNGVSLSTFLNNPRSPEAQEVLGAYERVKMALRGEGLMNTGVLQPGEVKMLEDLLIDPRSSRGLIMKPDAVQAKLGEFNKALLGLYNTRREQAGLAPVPTLSRAQPGAQGGWSIRPVQ